jgi:hypothetical protein
MVTYVYRDGKIVEKGSQEDTKYHYVVRDIEPYQSMIDGRMITSRSQHREHLRDNNCIEIGNEKMETKLPTVDREKRIKVLREQLWNVSDRDCNKVLDKMREQARFTRR